MVVTNRLTAKDLERAIKIGEGRYREVFRLEKYIIKLLKPQVRKSYGPFNLDFPSDFYIKWCFGIRDFNHYEYEVYRKLIKKIPKEFENNFAKIYSVGRLNEKSYSISDAILDENGEVSQPLSTYRKLNEPAFWSQMEKLEEILIEKAIPLMDIRGENILVQKNNGRVSPIFIDFKRYGRKVYPYQFWLFSKDRLIAKIRRRFQRLKERHMP